MKRGPALLLSAALIVWAGSCMAGPLEPSEPPRETAAAATAEPVRTPEPEEEAVILVYVTRSGSKYHAEGCQYLRSSCIPMELDEAKERYEPCSKCHPPR